MSDTATSSTIQTPPAPRPTLVARGLIQLVRFYQLGISPFLGDCCRFHPTCSQYFILAVQKYGALRGSLKGIGRIARCHPFHPGGIDDP